MTTQYIRIGNNKWDILVHYDVSESDLTDIADTLYELGCPKSDIKKSLNIVTKRFNTGMTFTNADYRISVVCISKVTSGKQFMNTLVHEAKHVQSHICAYYQIEENSEPAAYLIGYIIQQMYSAIRKYGRL